MQPSLTGYAVPTAANKSSARAKGGKRKSNPKRRAPRSQPSKRKDPNRGYWSPSTQTWSEKLLTCKKKECVQLEPKDWDKSLKDLASSAWYTVRAKKLVHPPEKNGIAPDSHLSGLIMERLGQKTAVSKPKPKPKPPSPSSNVTPVTEGAQPPKKKKQEDEEINPHPKRTRRIRVYPNAAQKEELNVWFQMVRVVYNKCVEVIREKEVDKKDAKEHSRKEQIRKEPIGKEQIEKEPTEKEPTEKEPIKKPIGKPESLLQELRRICKSDSLTLNTNDSKKFLPWSRITLSATLSRLELPTLLSWKNDVKPTHPPPYSVNSSFGVAKTDESLCYFRRMIGVEKRGCFLRQGSPRSA